MLIYKTHVFMSVAIGSIVAAAGAGPDWIEDRDAGSMVGSAQDTTGAGFVQTIAGTLGGEDQEDVYRINVQDANNFYSPINFGLRGDITFDAALWLFDSEGYGLLGNDNDPLLGGTAPRLITPSTDGVTLLLAPGTYYLAITESGNVPLSLGAAPGLGGAGVFQEIFLFANSTEVSGPDGPGADNPLAAWSGGAGNGGTYGIVVTPAPSTLGVLSLMGLGLARRRR